MPILVTVVFTVRQNAFIKISTWGEIKHVSSALNTVSRIFLNLLKKCNLPFIKILSCSLSFQHYCKRRRNTSADASGHIFSDVPGIMCVSGLSASYILLQTTQLRLIRPQHVYRWLASYWPHGYPLSPQPSLGSLCYICGVADGSYPPLSLDVLCAVGSGQGPRCKAPMPSGHLACIHQPPLQIHQQLS